MTSVVKPLFEKYTVDKNYVIHRTKPDGTISVIDDPRKVKRLLHSNFFRGSVAFTRDTAHIGIVHKLIYLFQKVKAFLTGKVYARDPSICHGMIILGRGKSKKDKPHPFLVAHALFGGIQTSNWDALQDKEVTELVIYKPIDRTIRDLYAKNARQTAFVKNEAKRTASSPDKMLPFSFGNMFASAFHYKKHITCGRKGPVPERMKKRTARIVADCILKKQLRNDFERPLGFFCASYAAAVLQGSFLLKAYENASAVAKKKFLCDAKGAHLKRADLVKKIIKAFTAEDKTSVVARRLYKVYHTNTLARADTYLTTSSDLVRKLDKLSVIKVK